MKIFKFGGASVKDAAGVKNVANVLRKFPERPLVLVVSAMDKTTNLLEKLTLAIYNSSDDVTTLFTRFKDFHYAIAEELFEDKGHPLFNYMNDVFVELEWLVDDDYGKGYDFLYDQIVSAGELISSRIVSEYLNKDGLDNSWVDIRDCIRTDNTYREGKIDWQDTEELSRKNLFGCFKNNSEMVVTQGFIGGTSENYTTTLGREGSDYTAAVLAYCLDAGEVIIWKDVAGLYNCDPKRFKECVKLEVIPYSEAIELSYYGASVIHPKTIKPLQNKLIPLKILCFDKPDEQGSVINNSDFIQPLVPSYIVKDNQILISVSAKDFSFIVEESLSRIFAIFAGHKIKMNLFQHSALSFTVSADYDPMKVPALLDELKGEFKVLYNDGLQLITIRHYTEEAIKNVLQSQVVYLEQRSRNTAHLVTRV